MRFIYPYTLDLILSNVADKEILSTLHLFLKKGFDAEALGENDFFGHND